MQSIDHPRCAADDFVATLALHGVQRVFCVPGESYLTLLDALGSQDAIATVTCRHEGGAAFMALATAKLTGRAAVCLVSRGPGATNAAIGLHLAQQDGVPLVLVVGDVRRSERGRGAFQEVEYATALGGLAKWMHVVCAPENLAEDLARAISMAERPAAGPVLLVVPEDVFDCPGHGPSSHLWSPVPARVGAAQLAKLRTLLEAAQRPLLMAGAGLRSSRARALLVKASERWALPVVTCYKQQDVFPNDSPRYAGHLGFKMAEKAIAPYLNADLVLALGTRLDDASTQGFRLPTRDRAAQRLVQVCDDAASIARVIPVDLGLIADCEQLLEDLLDGEAPRPQRDAVWMRRLHDMARPLPWSPGAPGRVEVGAAVNRLRERLGDDAILVTDSGNFSGWLHRHFNFRGDQQLLGAVGGAMGLGVPGAIAASLAFPKRTAVALVGDGGFMMTGAELATAMAFGARPKVIVCNNSQYGTIRTHQERATPGRAPATGLMNPDFAALARAFGIFGARVDRLDTVDAAIDAMLAYDGPAVLDLVVDPGMLAPGLHLRDLQPSAATR